MSVYRRATLLFALVAVGLGLAILVRTASAGGGSVGYTFGVLILALGCLRLYLLRRS